MFIIYNGWTKHLMKPPILGELPIDMWIPLYTVLRDTQNIYEHLTNKWNGNEIPNLSKFQVLKTEIYSWDEFRKPSLWLLNWVSRKPTPLPLHWSCLSIDELTKVVLQTKLEKKFKFSIQASIQGSIGSTHWQTKTCQSTYEFTRLRHGKSWKILKHVEQIDYRRWYFTIKTVWIDFNCMVSVQVSTQSPSIFQPFVFFWVPKSRGAWMEFHHGGSNIQKSIHLKPEPKQQSCDETGCTGWTLAIMNLERDNMLSELELPPTKKCTSNFEQVWVKLWTLNFDSFWRPDWSCQNPLVYRWFIQQWPMSFPLFHPETCSECHCERLRVKFWRLDIEHLWPTSRQLHLRKN